MTNFNIVNILVVIISRIQNFILMEHQKYENIVNLNKTILLFLIS